MFQEAASAATAVRTQLRQDAAGIEYIGAAIRRLAPRVVITCARGSSDHAATYAKYLIEMRARILTASAAPSVSSVYGISQDLRGCLFIAISQSGRSPDLLASDALAISKRARAYLKNHPASNGDLYGMTANVVSDLIAGTTSVPAGPTASTSDSSTVRGPPST